MSKDLPKMYVNEIKNDLNNNQCSFCTYDNNEVFLDKKTKDNISNKEKSFTKFELEQKIRRILDPKKYIYKANVNIVTENGIIEKKIVGYVNQNIITYDEEKINIKDIKDIYL